uniref:Uncharacterized protein n=1 Tax=Quercus lobata TaxID=97700 RepID=A0A7N2M8Q6_QUELO
MIWALRLKATPGKARRLTEEFSEPLLQIFPQKVQCLQDVYGGHFSRQWLALQMCSCDSWNAIISFCRRLNKNE